jgi:hypothetical protein
MNLQQRMYAQRIQNLVEAEDSPEQKAYKELFAKMLEKYGVDSPNDIPKEKKDDFFNEVEAAWKKDPANDSEGPGETKEEVEIQERADGGGAGGAGGKGGHGTPPPSVSDAAGLGPLTMNGMLAAFGTDDLRYDLNGDGIVDGADLGLFLAKFGG